MHHNDLPEGDPRHDVSDLFAFTSPEAPHRTVLILDVHPELSPRAEPMDPRVSLPHPVRPPMDTTPMDARRWAVVALCFLIALLDGFDTQSVAFIGIAIADEFKLSAADMT